MNNINFINYLKKQHIFVISPHFDDAMLSMGMVLNDLKKYKNTTVINIFTKAHYGPYTLSGQKNIKIAGYSNAVTLFKDREVEDQKALSAINVNIINLDLEDADFRLKSNFKFIGKFIPELNHMYPTHRWHVTKKIYSGDNSAKKIKTQLKNIIPINAQIFAPIGVGNHADHIIAHKVCTQMFKNIFYYVDFPYNIRQNNYGTPPPGYKKLKYDIDLEMKEKLLKLYKSQINGLFPGGIVPFHSENFFIPNKIL